MNLFLAKLCKLLVNGGHNDSACFVDFCSHFEACLHRMSENVFQHFDDVTESVVFIVEQDHMPWRLLLRQHAWLGHLTLRRGNRATANCFHSERQRHSKRLTAHRFDVLLFEPKVGLLPFIDRTLKLHRLPLQRSDAAHGSILIG